MKYKLIIDKSAEEEITVVAHAPSSLTRQIEELCNIKDQLRKDMKNRWGE